MSDEESSIEKRLRLQKVLVAWDSFIASEAYRFFKEAQILEAEGTRQAIVMLDPVDRVGEIESYKLRGDLRTEEAFISYFEDTAARLKDRIEELLEAEQPSSNKQ